VLAKISLTEMMKMQRAFETYIPKINELLKEVSDLTMSQGKQQAFI